MTDSSLGPFQLTLYVTGDSAKSQFALDNLRSILETDFPASYQLTVVDILEEPQQAEAQGILATPTLIKQAPSPERRVIGDFSDQDKVLAGLGLAKNQAREIPAGGR